MAPRTSARNKDTTEDTSMEVTVDNPDDDETPENAEEPPPTTNGGFEPQRSQLVTDIPTKSRSVNTYDEWADEIMSLSTTDLGFTAEYNDVPNCAGVAQGLKRVYGVIAKSRGLVTDENAENKGYGTLYVSVPVNEDGTISEQAIAATKSKYAK